MPFQLVVVRGRSSTNHHRLGPGVSVVGRQEGCQLQIKSSQVSRKHCEFFEKNGRLIVKDLNSSNGTFVNGERIKEQRVLEVGDEVALGGVKFRVESVSATGAGPADTAVTAAATVSPARSDIQNADMIPLDDNETIMVAPASPEAAAVPAPKSTKTQVAEPEEEEQVEEIGEDAVAEFLMDLDVDEDDKR